MHRDRIKWNEKYRRQDYPTEPSRILKDFFSMALGGTALDLAAGSGRNALFLAERGFAVDAVDISEEGLALFAGRHPGIRPICADLDTFDIPIERYDLILNILFLNRRLFPQIREGLRPGGMLIFETLIEMPGGAGHGERCRDYFLRPNELLHSFLSLRILHYREEYDTGQDEHRRLASLVAVRPHGHFTSRGGCSRAASGHEAVLP
ncbi:MAG: class I SAM-dependent methyltransferase [Deltaproteobacteria bacterium]|nr:class I SAM-dependent methyltransferase [Deltaproteobacteria bacterium]